MHGMRATKIGRLWELKVWKTKREQQNQPFLPALSAHGPHCPAAGNNVKAKIDFYTLLSYILLYKEFKHGHLYLVHLSVSNKCPRTVVNFMKMLEDKIKKRFFFSKSQNAYL